MENQPKNWSAQWITAHFATVKAEPEFTLEEMFSGQLRPQDSVEERLKPSVYFKRIFALEKKVQSAHLTITAQGIYQASLNGQPVTEAIFTPDYTDYQKWLMYQTYDVTALLEEGTNVLAVEVADGWYAGRISVQGGSCQFGDQLALLAELEVIYADGSQEIIGTDQDFTVGTGKHRYADIQIGEKQDLRLETTWKTDQTPLAEPAEMVEADDERLAPQEGPLVYRQDLLPAQKVWQEGQSWIVDFGQVIAGRVRLEIDLALGQELVIEHSETLDESGRFFTNIIGRNKDARDVFIGRGQREVLEPDFTFHGFRYAKLTGIDALDPQAIQAVVIYSQMKETGQLQTSDEQVNQLLSNILWSQRGNMLSIPTDCPQRERVGWTGDMQVFAPSSTFFLNTESFIRRWLKSVRLDQRTNGEILDYSPAPRDAAQSVAFTGSYSSAGWGDAIVLVPWILYERYGDQSVLEENYEAMVAWVTYAQDSAAGEKTGLDRYIWDTKFHYGDWMFPSLMMQEPNPMKTAQVTKDLVATAFLAHSAELLGQISSLLGRDGSSYLDYADQVKVAFRKRFVTAEGHLTADYQGCYVLALAFHLIDEEEQAQRLLARLVDLIEENGYRLDTGFVSVPYLLDVLCQYGQTDLARTVFFQDQCPSWFYEIQQGATTIWESWAGIQPDGKVGSFSFNHYAFGCVLDWILRETVGVKVQEAGYRSILIQPTVEIVENFTYHYESASGPITIQKKGKNWTINTAAGIDVTLDLSAVGGVKV